MASSGGNALIQIESALDGVEALLTTANTNSTILAGLDTQKFGGVAATARSPFASVAPTVNTGAAAVAIKAAVTSKKHWITKAVFCNKTAGEYPVIELTGDHDGTPVIHWTGTTDQPIATSLGYTSVEFDPPIEVASGTSIGFQLQSATGDVYAHVYGWVED